jgi:hypothetical protein
MRTGHPADEDDSYEWDITEEAVAKLTDTSALADIAKKHRNEYVREVAIGWAREGGRIPGRARRSGPRDGGPGDGAEEAGGAETVGPSPGVTRSGSSRATTATTVSRSAARTWMTTPLQ